MPPIECILANLTYKLYLADKYGLTDKKLQETFKTISKYFYLLTQTSECITDCMLDEINLYLQNNYYCKLDSTPCIDQTIICGSISISNITPMKDCSNFTITQLNT